MARVTGQRFSVNVLSVLSPRGALRFVVVRGGVGASVFIEFLKRLMQGQRRKAFLIVDSHPSHRAKKVKTFVESLKGKLQLFFLPPYSSELNPRRTRMKRCEKQRYCPNPGARSESPYARCRCSVALSSEDSGYGSLSSNIRRPFMRCSF